MDINLPTSALRSGSPTHTGRSGQSPSPLREAFDDFVGQTFYGQLLSSLRSTVKPAPYFHGGHAEQVFQSQLDQVLAEKLADASSHQFTEPMFELFQNSRK